MANRYGYCHICGKWANLDVHHVYGGAYRKKSERYRMVVCICRDCHNEIHFGKRSKELMLMLRKEYQKRFMYLYPKEDFIKVFGRNYLDEPAVGEEKTLDLSKRYDDFEP